MSLDPGQDYLEGLRAALTREGVTDGIMLSTVATFARCRLHQVQSLTDVTDQRVLTLEGPVEVAGVSGVIAAGEPHLHASVADRDGRAYGGHLEPDCPVLYLAEASVLAVASPGMRRSHGENGATRLLPGAEREL